MKVKSKKRLLPLCALAMCAVSGAALSVDANAVGASASDAMYGMFENNTPDYVLDRHRLYLPGLTAAIGDMALESVHYNLPGQYTDPDLAEDEILDAGGSISWDADYLTYDIYFVGDNQYRGFDVGQSVRDALENGDVDYIDMEFLWLPETGNGVALHVRIDGGLYVNTPDLLFVDGGPDDGTTTYNATLNAPTNVGGEDVVTSVATWLTAGISQLGAGIGTGVSSFVTSLAIKDGSLSPYFVAVCVFGGIALAVCLTTKVFNWLSALGA